MKFNLSTRLAQIIFVSTCIACGSSSSSDSDTTSAGVENNEANSEIIANITDNVIVDGYAGLDEKVGELVTALGALRDDPTQDKLEAAQDAWKEARVYWESGEGHIFGPVDTLGVDPATDSWPVVTTDLDTQLGGWSSGDSVEGYEDEVKGFHAIEYILFGSGAETNTRDVSTLSDNQRAYVYALAVSMKGQTEKLLSAWNDEYTETFKSFTPSEAAEELLGGMIGIVDEVGNGKIGDPYNEKDITAVESQFSWNSTTDFSNNIISVKNVWEAGMDELVAQVEPDQVDVITAQINDAIAKIKAISDADNDGEIDADVKELAFRNQILDEDGRALIQAAIEALSELQLSLESLQGKI